ncbi:condensation domain-containing protein [Streptomyces sp. NPDC047123]|uniref:condensation domain-containing protein n=1 Tax=Streptomyces sp. NPDC047123 TaxID=3155622 RepID=UPI0033CFEC3A
MFADILGLPEVGVDDDFFELGGDSIVSIRLVARARARGLVISARDVFRRKTVAELAKHAKERAPKAKRPARTTDPAPGIPARAATASDGTSTRELLAPPAPATVAPTTPTPASSAQLTPAASESITLTPIIRWQRDRGGPVDGFHQSVLVRTPAGLRMPRLRAMIQHLLDRHDALRTRLRRGADWHIDVLPRDAAPATEPLVRVDITGSDVEQLARTVRDQRDAARRRLAPEQGTMLQAVWFDAGPGRDGRLMLMINHLVVDGISWRILLQDLRTAWETEERGAAGATTVDGTGISFADWGAHLTRSALARTGELPFWTGVVGGADGLLPGVALAADRDVLGTQGSVSRILPADRTEQLLTRVPAALGTGINTVLLTALGEAVRQWRTGHTADPGAPFLVDVEGHGREEIADDLDLSSTVGWFTSMFPVRLGGPADGAEAALRAVDDQLTTMPDKGLGYGLLRYLNPETAPALARLPRADVMFNYLGRFDRPDDTAWGLAPEVGAVAGGGDPEMPQTHLLEISAVTMDQDDGPELHVTWAYPTALLDAERVAELADLWEAALAATTARTQEQAPAEQKQQEQQKQQKQQEQQEQQKQQEQGETA